MKISKQTPVKKDRHKNHLFEFRCDKTWKIEYTFSVNNCSLWNSLCKFRQNVGNLVQHLTCRKIYKSKSDWKMVAKNHASHTHEKTQNIFLWCKLYQDMVFLVHSFFDNLALLNYNLFKYLTHCEKNCSKPDMLKKNIDITPDNSQVID